MRYIAAIGALAGATLLGSSAFAADLYTPAPVYEPVAAAPAANYFAGPYIGLHGGWGWADADASYVDSDFNEPYCGNAWGCAIDLDPEGAFVGGQLGWNFVLPSGLMLGIEGDYSFASIKDNANGTFCCALGLQQSHADLNIDQMATVLARVGWVWGRWMPFIAGGWGWAHGERDINSSFPPGFNSSDSAWHDGWVAGGGVEYAINEHWTLKGEYRYFDGGEETYSVGFAGGTQYDLQIQTVRFGVNYNF